MLFCREDTVPTFTVIDQDGRRNTAFDCVVCRAVVNLPSPFYARAVEGDRVKVVATCTQCSNRMQIWIKR